MKSKRFKEEQIIRILQEAESGLTVADVCRKHNCSEQSFYRWKAKFVALRFRRPSGYGNWSVKTRNSRRSPRIRRWTCGC